MKVELRPALCWDCDHCGRTQLEECIVRPGEIEGQYCMSNPAGVMCKHCGRQYQTSAYGEVLDE